MTNAAVGYILFNVAGVLLLWWMFKDWIYAAAYLLMRTFDPAPWKKLWKRYRAILLLPLSIVIVLLATYAVMYAFLFVGLLVGVYVCGYAVLAVIALVHESLTKNKRVK